MKIVTLAIQNKILLAILAGVVSIGSFQVWQYNQAKYEKVIAVKENNCKVYIEMAEDSVKRSPSLRNFKYNNVVNQGIKQPGINSESEVDRRYILLYNKPVSTLPANALVYENGFFKSLLSKGNYPPESLLVDAVSFDLKNRQATVSSDCAKKPFVVKLENLYETVQPVDIDIRGSNSDLFF
ncbi:hypothetical protein LC613_41630 [Nostoc sphaeroides CHAB 2801]|uniref:hypothetical protein n=1 Tax=Nostoc sphaeroides TaxID=446679 RepID=UPI001E4A2653|nr:hypothetical protein [Nostoc sphaeroides]MCC5633918.1 hypothetical protein [Nostoc sphaeroides CHAB 2801]